MNEGISEFIAEIRTSLAAGTFVKLTLGNYKGTVEQLQKIFVRPIETRKGKRLYFQEKHERRDVAKHYEIEKGVSTIEDLLNQGFRSGHLFTTDADIQLDIGKRNSRINRSKPTFKTTGATSHDRPKTRIVNPDAFYLKALGVTNDRGEVLAQKSDKWKQINKFVETVDGLFRRSALAERDALTITDMGSGKGYLTFAVFDHFANTLGLDVTMTGVDQRSDLVDICNSIAAAGDDTGLSFVKGEIGEYNIGQVDMLIALHACDTATDDALFAGSRAGAEIIVAAPCCHHQVRDQMCSPKFLGPVLKHPVLFERTAESLTDGIRSLLLERAGYKTKMFEFIAAEHTPKNNLLVAVKHGRPIDVSSFDNELREIFSTFCIEKQRLAELMEIG